MNNDAFSKKFGSGQTIVLFMVTLLAILVFTGLAIEGSAIYALRRSAQNAADAAAMAGAYAKCLGQNFFTTAINMAQNNNFINNDTTSVTVNNPPISGVHVGDNTYVETIITSTLPSLFVQLVFGGPLQTTVRAVSRCKPNENNLPYVLYILNSTECGSLTSNGGSNITVVGGGIYINSNGNGGTCEAAKASGVVDAGSAGIDVVGHITTTGGGIFNQPLREGITPQPDPLAHILVPPTAACAGASQTHMGNGGSDVINPGHYSKIKRTGGILSMNPGVYCIESNNDNDGIVAEASSQIQGSDVMIFIKRGSITLGGQATANLSAPTSTGCNGEACNYMGMVIYSDKNNNGSGTAIALTGGTGSIFTGTIYAPSNLCAITGDGSEIIYNSAMYCGTMTVSGGGSFNLSYNSGQNYKLPTAELSE